jgi:amino acid adenylation domain-containing protein
MSHDAHHLSHLLAASARADAQRIAVEDERGRCLSYADLDRAVDRLATRLARWGVGRGDRVGLFLPKSIESVVAIHAVLRAGAAYVPVDPTAPPSRGAGILADAHVRAAIVSSDLAPVLRGQWPGSGPVPRLVVVGSATDHSHGDTSYEAIQQDDAPTPLFPVRRGDDLAYILYTSGSTGTPKGVMLAHDSAFCFLDWCAGALPLEGATRYASHAPFHFDLSVFDLFATCRAGGTLVLIGESLGKDPARLGDFLAARQLDVWYSAPSILVLLAQYGGLERSDFPAPRLVLFAGVVCPIRHLKRLRALWPGATMWNLYGPTETNVCTAEPIPSVIDRSRNEPFPIGRVCPPLRARVTDEAGNDVAPGQVGELRICGPGVMRGYFARPDLDAAAFATDADGTRWYRTGDLVVSDDVGRYTFHGRRDRMVKKRGYRIELGEIESALYRHEDVERAAVVARDDEAGVAIAAFVAMKPGRKGSIIAMKKHCTTYLPNYMVPDTFRFVPQLPTTSTDKVDYRVLATEGNPAPRDSR